MMASGQGQRHGPDSHSRLAAAWACLGASAPEDVGVLGDLSILNNRLLALFCSERCPGDPIIKTYDIACALRDAGVTVAGGFHSPMERECLDFLLRGAQPVIVCPARGMYKRLPKHMHKPLKDGRLLVLSPFTDKQRRPTKKLARERNRFVAALADEILITYADPGGSIEALCREALAWGKTVYTLKSPDTTNLVELGAKLTAAENLT